MEEEEYTVIRQIGKGAFGKVLLVETGNTREKYVIKQVNTANMTQNETVKVRMIMIFVFFMIMNCEGPQRSGTPVRLESS